MSVRSSFRNFVLANSAYIAATLTLHTVDGNGVKTTTKAILYSGATGTGTLANPQTLDSEGKLAQPVYVETAVIATVSGLSIADHDTGIFHPTGTWRSDWVTATLYYAGEYVRAGGAADGTNDIYSVEQTHTSGTFATDVSGGQLALAIDVSSFSAVDATLAALAALVTAADETIYATGVDAFAMTSLTAFGRSLIAAANAAAARATLGVNGLGVLDAPVDTLMLFQQTTAPAGWTKETTHDDKSLRVVTGTASSGGVTAFNTVFGTGKTAGDTTLTSAQSGVPAHLHAQNSVTLYSSGSANQDHSGSPNVNVNSNSRNTANNSAADAASPHDHTVELDLQYVDIIIAKKVA